MTTATATGRRRRNLVKRVRHMISMSDPKYLPMMLLPLLVVYLAYGPPTWWMVAGGAAAVIALNLGAVLVNTWSDREADAVNMPRGRDATETHIGYSHLPIWIGATYFVIVAATVIMGFAVSWQVSVLYTAGWLIGTCYSVGPRLKRSLVFSRVCIACGPGISFAGGWVLRHSITYIPAVVSLLFVAQGINTLLKDVPDAEGDRRMGVRTLFTGMDIRNLWTLLPVLWTIPYALAAAGALLGWWPRRYLWLLLLWPIGLLISRSPFAARSQAERELVREIAQMYATSWVIANLLLFSQKPVVVILCAAGAVFYIAVLASGTDRRAQEHRVQEVMRFWRQAAVSFPHRPVVPVPAAVAAPPPGRSHG